MPKQSTSPMTNPGFDDENQVIAPTEPKPAKEGRQGRSAADSESSGEASRFTTDFESDTETDDFADVWISGGQLPEIPARPGYMQRYVNTTDPANLAIRLRQGWKPRRSETVPKGIVGTPSISSGEYTGCVGVIGQVLMEMPIALWRKHKQATDGATKKLEEALENDIYKVARPGYMAPTAKESTTQVSVGRRPNIPDE